ncbi:glycoside hydrolase family 3 protein [Thermophilibacter sp.]
MHDTRNLSRREALLAAGTGAVLALAGCAPAPSAPAADDRGEVTDTMAEQSTPEQPASPADELSARVDEKIAALSLEQKVWQLFVVRPEAVTGVSTQTAAGEATRAALAERPVGGIVYFAANLLDADQTRSMLANTAAFGEEVTGLPLFLGVDEEGGTVSRVGGNPGFGVDNVGNMRDVGATGDAEHAREVASHIGDYLTYLGFNVDFAPDADIASNPDGEMGLRAFGSTADAVCPMVAAQVKGFTEAGIICCAKHFPGIGGALGDSHDARIYSEKTADELRAEELLPFESAIEAGVPMVMVGHLSLPEITGDDDPASVSPEVVTGLLRDGLGYDGVVITDSMGMGAATSSLPTERLAVEALLAGVDLVLMPADLDAAHQGVIDAVATGELTEERLDESLRRVLRLKLDRLA